MEELFDKLLALIFKYQATDVHLTLKENNLKISLRGNNGILDVKDEFEVSIFHYLKFISNLDLGNVNVPQSGNFTYRYKHKELYFRFSFLQTLQIQSAVLRVLNNHERILIDDLSKDKKQNDVFKKWCQFRSGLTIISGPTGSGKTTTLNAILESISDNHKLKVITLEDPIEIQSEQYLQLQINERMNFGYEEGIKQLLRHDPDVIMIGEIRDSSTAKSLIRCALSGHMVFTTIHAKTCKEAILRLLDFGVKESDLKEVLTSLTNQRIFPIKSKKGKVCIYEVMEKNDISYYFENKKTKDDYQNIFDEIKKGVQKNWISKNNAQQDISF